MPGAEDVESRPKIGRRGQPLQDREPMPGAEDVESRPKTGRRGQPLQDREPMPGAEDPRLAGRGKPHEESGALPAPVAEDVESRPWLAGVILTLFLFQVNMGLGGVGAEVRMRHIHFSVIQV